MNFKRIDKTLAEFVESDELPFEKIFFVRGCVEFDKSEYHFTFNYYQNPPEFSVFCEDSGVSEQNNQKVTERMKKCLGTKLSDTAKELYSGKPIKNLDSKKEIAEIIERIFDEFSEEPEWRFITIDYNRNKD